MQRLCKVLVLIVLICCFLIPCTRMANSADPTGFVLEPFSDEAFSAVVQFYHYDSDIPLDVRVIEKTNSGAYTREKIVFDGSRDSRVPGYLAIPKAGQFPCPCILQLHGFTGNKGEWYDDGSYYGGGLVTKAMIGAGFAVFALDAEYHGERMLNNDFEKPNAMKESGWDYRVISMIVQSTVDYRRAIDYLETRDEIDPGRIGVHGYSMGGMMAFQLTAVEPRVKTTVSCVSWTIRDNTFDVINPYNFARAVGDRPFLMLMGTKDPLLPFKDAQKIYGLIGGPQKNIMFFDSGHRLPDEYVNHAVKWFEDNL